MAESALLDMNLLTVLLDLRKLVAYCSDIPDCWQNAMIISIRSP
jgi:hypothetical protein